MGKEYRIKEPRCWVVRWKRHPCFQDPSTDYVGDGTLCPKGSAKEFPSPDEARRFVDAAQLDWEVWRVVRRGKVSR